MSGPRIHERERPVGVAKAQVEIAFWEAVMAQEIELTSVEILQALSTLQQAVLRDMLRFERHGDLDTPAGWARDDE